MSRYSPFQVLVQRLASSGLVSAVLSRTLHSLDRAVRKLTHGHRSLTSILSGAPVVVVTTTGVRSGLPRTLPLLCIRDLDDLDRFALIASNWGQRKHPAWYYNLKANPRATCRIDGLLAAYVAHEATDEEYRRYWQLATQTYAGFALYRRRAGDRRIPILVLTRSVG